MEVRNAGTEKEYILLHRDEIKKAIACYVKQEMLIKVDWHDIVLESTERGTATKDARCYNLGTCENLEQLRKIKIERDNLIHVCNHLDFGSIWPVECVDGKHLGRLVWPLNDPVIDEWVKAHVRIHICDSEAARARGPIFPYQNNGKAVRMMCLVDKEEYDKLQKDLQQLKLEVKAL